MDIKMKKLIKRSISIILAFVVIINMGTSAFAANKSDGKESISTVAPSEVEIARQIYNGLESKARAIFENEIMRDHELLEFHVTYVDENFAGMEAEEVTAVPMAVTSAMTILSSQLAALSLPSAVVYSLKAMGASMVAAIADGPLPVGDILLAAATASTAVVIAANWNAVSTKWNKIVLAFKKAFSSSAKNVVSAFSSIKKDVDKEMTLNPCITISGKTITVNGEKYNCITKADQLTSKQKKNYKYYPALLFGGTVWVDVNHGLASGGAKKIIGFNHNRLGIWATNSSYARGICGGSYAIWHNVHSSAEGYFFHYHHPSYKNSHCWYL